MVWGLIGILSNEYNDTIRGRPVVWTNETWSEVYDFQVGGSGTTSQKDYTFEDLPERRIRKKASPLQIAKIREQD